MQENHPHEGDVSPKIREQIVDTVALFCRWNVKWFALSLLDQEWLADVRGVDYSHQWVIVHFAQEVPLLQLSVGADSSQGGELTGEGFTIWTVDRSEESNFIEGVSRGEVFAVIEKLISTRIA